MEEKRPEFDQGKPVWWNHHGTKMRLKAQGILNDFAIIQSSAAELIIKREKTYWRLEWRIGHGVEGMASGCAIFSNDDLLQAFGLLPIMGEYGEWLVARYGGTTASQFKYIRYQNWLNIPCPGTGHDGDPNVSIELNQEIKDAVKNLAYHSAT
jgi:hypothetical protein